MPSIKIGSYILYRLKEVGIDTIFGVPGDYTLALNELVENDSDLVWGNNANELNSAYAADGYARIKGVGALVTAMGVGELSAINGIAGSFAEMVPVIHIVGTASLEDQDNHAILHHTLGNGDFHVFTNIASMVTVATANLRPENALAEIDRVIQTAILNRRPGYMTIPCNIVNTLVDVPEDILPLNLTPKPNPTSVQNSALDHVIAEIKKAKNPIIYVDGPALRFGLSNQVNTFIEKSGFPAFSSPMAKGTIDQNLSNYRGIYGAYWTLPDVLEEYSKADLLINLGSIPSDLNIGKFKGTHSKDITITLNFDQTSVYHVDYKNVGFEEFLPLLTATIEKGTLVYPPRIKKDVSHIDKGRMMSQQYFWSVLSNYLEPDCIITTEQGSSLHGALHLETKGKASFLNQYLWGSIGYSVPAALGAALAAKKRRVYLLVGDGSFQMTAQEIAVYIRHGITPIIIVINNDGYLIEKLLITPTSSYNSFQMWNYSKSLDYFGGHLKTNAIGLDKHPSRIGIEAKIQTRRQFKKAMVTAQKQVNKIHFLEVIFPAFDSPQELTILCEQYSKKSD